MPHLKLSVLGSMQIALANTPIAKLESDKTRALLVYLVVEADQAHRRDALMGLLWPDSPQETARHNLRQALFNLRQAIGDHTANPRFLFITRDEIQFNPASAYSLDVAEFNAHLAATAHHAHQQLETCAVCVSDLQQAIGLYRGNFLQEFFLEDSADFEEWALNQREQLRRRAQESLAHLANHYEKRGEYERAQHFTARQLDLDSWREEAHRQLIRLLALNGQRSEALAQYEKCRLVLRDELGIEPSAETRALYQQIKDQVAFKPAEVKAKNEQAQTRYPSSLPVSLTPFVGRERELGELAQLLADPSSRLVSVVGPGGIGKTRLALEAGSNLKAKFADGVVFVSLAPITSSAFISSAVGEAVGLVISGQMELKLQLLHYLRGKRMLMVLDNLEHLLADETFQINGAGLFIDLLEQAPQIKLLITSREPLNLQHEWIFQLGGLDLPLNHQASTFEKSSAVALFAQSARRAQVGFGVKEKDRTAVTRICQLVSGNPLGIELAASWVRTLSCNEIAQEIERNLDFLAVSRRDVPERHRSMRAVFDSSWHMLGATEQQALAKLSVFRAGFSRDAAEQVAEANLPVLALLIAKSLVRRIEGGRYGFHELVRLHAHEKLIETGGLDATCRAHLNYFLELVEAAEPKLFGAEQTTWLDRLEQEHDNLRAALEWSLSDISSSTDASRDMQLEQVQTALRLAGALFFFWKRRDHWSEGRQWLGRALAQSADFPPTKERLKSLNAAVVLAVEQADIEPARKLSEENLALAHELGDPHAMAAALCSHGYLLWKQKDFATAREHCEKGLTLFRMLGDREAVAESLHYLGHIATSQDDYEGARAFLEESAAIYQTIGDALGWNFSLNDLGLLAYLQNDHVTARSLFETSLAGFRQVRSIPGIISSLNGLGDLARSTGDYDRAGTLYEECVTLYRDMGDQDEFPSLLHNLAYVMEYHGDHEQALDMFREALTREREIHNRAGIAECLVGLAGVLIALGDPRRAARLFGAAEALRESVGAKIWPADRIEYDRSLAKLAQLLDSETLTSSWRVGQKFTIEEVISDAVTVGTLHASIAQRQDADSQLKGHHLSIFGRGLIARDSSARSLRPTNKEQ